MFHPDTLGDGFMIGRRPDVPCGEVMVDGAELQRAAQLVELNRHKMERLAEQIQRLEGAVDEHREVLVGLNAMAADSEARTMIPLGAGIQLVVDRPEGGGVVMDIGSGIQAERPIPDAITLLEKRSGEIEQLLNTLQGELHETEMQVAELAQVFNEGVQKLQSQAPEEHVDDEEKKGDSPKKRRSSIGGELTLDD